MRRSSGTGHAHRLDFTFSVSGRALVWAAALIGLLSSSTVVAGENPYANDRGVADADFSPNNVVFGYDRAGMSLNPGGVGQVLFAPYYDVRVVREASGYVDAQQTLITIRNSSPSDPDSPGYDPYGGVLFSFKLRDPKLGVLTMTFPVLLGCGQTWRAAIFRGPEGFPHIRSDDPIVQGATFDQLFTGPKIAGPDGDVLRILDLFAPGAIEPSDLQTGSLEVFAIEAASCQPDDPPVSPRGNTWTRPDLAGSRSIAAQNVLSGSVEVIRILADTATKYEMTAIARHRPVPDSILIPGAVPISFIFGNETPNESDCLGFLDGSPYVGTPACTRQLNTALSRSRLRVPFHNDADGRPTLLALGFRRVRNCNLSFSLRPSKAYPGTPYSCDSAGERVAVSIQSDLGEVVARRTLRLTRHSTLLAIGGADPRADVTIGTEGLTSGVVELDFARDKKGNLLHGERVPTTVDVNGAGYVGYEGLPLFAARLQPTTSYGPEGATDASEPVFDVSYLTD